MNYTKSSNQLAREYAAAHAPLDRCNCGREPLRDCEKCSGTGYVQRTAADWNIHLENQVAAMTKATREYCEANHAKYNIPRNDRTYLNEVCWDFSRRFAEALLRSEVDSYRIASLYPATFNLKMREAIVRYPADTVAGYAQALYVAMIETVHQRLHTRIMQEL